MADIDHGIDSPWLEASLRAASHVVFSSEGLATSLERAGTGSQAPLWDRLAAVDVPVLLVAGEADPRYVDIAFRTSAAIGPGTELSLVADAGHSVHLEHPRQFAGMLRGWLASWS